MVRKLNVDGDAQADLVGHGGEHRAVFVYQLDSYRFWEKFLGRNDFTFGQFGENFTVEGLPDNEVCIGDRYRIGGAEFEVTQPRVTCYRVGIRMDEPRMPALLVQQHRPGFYLRVLKEGEVAANDEIIKIADGPQKMSIADIDALLYLPGHSAEQLYRALQIPALSHGWQASFQSMLDQDQKSRTTTPSSDDRTPAWTGFRPLRVHCIQKESASVTSILFKSVNSQPLPAYHAGQFVVVRLPVDASKPPILRSYSLSGPAGADQFRISIKSEPNGVGSAFLSSHVKVGDVLDVSAPRGNFVLAPGDGPVVLLSAGVGATPVLAMLHALAAERSQREVWWIYGARNAAEHPFAEESRSLLKQLARGRGHIVYSKPAETDKLGQHYDIAGHVDVALLRRLGAPQDGDFYLCGPASFLQSMRDGLRTWGIPDERVHAETFGAVEASTPGTVQTVHTPQVPKEISGSGPAVAFARSGITVPWDGKFRNLLELAEACNVPVRWSCRVGVCHTCVRGIIDGSITYDPQPLEEPSSGSALICCSRPEARGVTLDI